ncbi:MAG: Ig-like domain-containing protein, partial [Anaerolineales bacterium]
ANDSWVNALPLSAGDIPASVDQSIDRQGQSRWYKFSIQPNSKVIVTLTNLPANYDLTLYKDISVTLQSLNSQALNSAQDLERLGAEFAPDAFSPDAFSPDAFSPDAFSPDAFSPDAFSPDAFSPDAFSPDAFSPDAFSPDAFSPDAFSPDAFSPDAFSPDAFSPDAFSPDAFSPDAFSPDAFSGAQTRSLIAISAFEGIAGEGVLVNTWENTGEFYVRVRGRNGAFRLGIPFHLQVVLLTGSCDSVSSSLPATSLTATAGNYKTIILTDPGRMGSTSTLADKLAALAARPEVAGVVVDVGADVRAVAANQQATDHPDCPFAKNLVAQSIKDIVDAYRTLNPLEYVVIVGNDDVIPFFRHPDQALLASEKNYVPPVRDNTASQASLKLGYVLSQDRYGAGLDISSKTNMLPLPGLAVGRLVETEADAIRLLDAYLGTADGVVPPPTSALVTGYDFLEDAALAVQAELEAGIGAPADTLISDRNLSPLDPAAWTADGLRTQLLGSRHGLIFLAGHFSANSALAADYRTRLSATEVANSSVDLENAIIFSAGCHSGYNIVNPHGIPGVTVEPDWAQAFAQKGATLIAGTGYQYGDTDFIEYSERLYLEFSRQLRAGTGPVAVGKALAAAKQAYLAGTPQMRAIHEKAYLEATLFGLPMLSVDLPAGRGGTTGDTSIVSETNNVSANPGAALGLSFADVLVTPSLTEHTVVLSSTAGSTVTAMYPSGSNGVVANPAEPVLPLEVRNVSVPGTALRGVGFRGGNFSDAPNVLPLLGAATTEIRGVHTPFLSDVFYPIRPWSVNYFDALAGGSDGATYLMLLPAQVQSSAPGASTAVLRRFSDMGFRLYYSDNATTYAGNSTPALAAPPTIVRVSATPGAGDVTFSVRVVGNPAAGIQEVWVTYSAVSGPLAGHWQSLDLTQSATDSTLWQGTLPLGETISEDIRYIVQAANGVGLVSLDTNQGEFYTPGIEVEPTQPTAITFQTPPASGPYGSRATFSAILTNNGTPLANQRVVFRLGSQGRQAFTDSAGSASAILPLLGLPDQYQVRVSFAGTDTYIASSAESSFTITRQGTLLSLAPASATGHLGEDGLMVATLKDAAGRPLSEKTVFFVVSGTDGSYGVAVITDFAGRATLDRVPLPVGSYTINAYFSGIIPLPAGTLSLDDERYQPATTTGSLALITFPPVAEPDAYSLDGGETLTVEAPGVLGNDNDADGDSLTALLVEGPAHGTLSLNPDGSFSYTPNLNFSGSDSFTYKARDIHDAESNVVAVTLTVSPVNIAPSCASATASVDALWPPDKEFKPVTMIGVTDPDGDPILITISGIRQDEPVGNRPDGQGVGTSIAE